MVRNKYLPVIITIYRRFEVNVPITRTDHNHIGIRVIGDLERTQRLAPVLKSACRDQTFIASGGPSCIDRRFQLAKGCPARLKLGRQSFLGLLVKGNRRDRTANADASVGNAIIC